jgi:hypothetical protein
MCFQDAGKSARKSQLRKPHLLNPDSCASSTDEGASGVGLLNGSTGARSVAGSADSGDPPPVFEYLKHRDRRNPSHQRLFPTAWSKAWAQNQGPDPLMDALADSHSVYSGSDSFSLNTDSPLSDAGLPDPGILPANRLLRNYYPSSSSRSSEPAGDSEYEAPVHENQSGKPSMTLRPSRTDLRLHPHRQ